MVDNYYEGLTGEIVTPCDDEYEEARQEYNRSIQKFPNVIVYCYDKDDVINAVLWAQERCMQIRIRNGGHSYEGYSIGNNVIVIDVSKMNKLNIDEKQNILKIQSGVINSQIYELLGKKGYPFPSGTCPTVGATALTLGGGWGLSCRHLGLTCDSLLSLELVDYEGKVITANEEENSDLFWACKGGGGGNFGVVISMTYKLPEKVDKVCLIKLNCPNATKKEMKEFLNIWQEWLINLDDRISLVARLFNTKDDGKEILGTGILYGTQEEAEEILNPFTAIEKMDISIKYLPFISAIESIEATYPPYEKFKTTGRFVYFDYNDEEIDNLIEIVKHRPRGSKTSGFSLYALGGKVSEVNKYDTAFYHRNAKYIIAIQTMWDDAKYKENNVNWVNQNFRYLKSITNGSYINFPYSNLKNYDAEYYGENVCRLKEIDEKYDPFNVFEFPQSIIKYI